MAIRFDDIIFDHVDEVIEYMEKTQRKVVEKEKQVVKTKPRRAVRESVGKSHMAWTAEDDKEILALIKRYGDDKIPTFEYDRLTKLITGRTRIAITSRTCYLRAKKPNNTKKPGKSKRVVSWNEKEDEAIRKYYKENERPIRLKPLAEKLGKKNQDIANRARALGVQKPLKAPSLEFPKIYPLSADSHHKFEQMLVDMIARNGKISMFDAQSVLELKNGKEWCGRVWREFIEQFQLNLPKIKEALVMKDPNKLGVMLENGYHYIKYK